MINLEFLYAICDFLDWLAVNLGVGIEELKSWLQMGFKHLVMVLLQLIEQVIALNQL
jgi:hypothetical protein